MNLPSLIAALICWCGLAIARAPTAAAGDDPPLTVVGELRAGSAVRFLKDGEQVIVHITSKFGIDKATIRRRTDDWPRAIVVRLHLTGLESFKAGNKDVTIEWSVATAGPNATRVSVRHGQNEEQPVGANNPFFSPVRIVRGDGNPSDKLPLKDGYFEIALPAKLLGDRATEVTLQWVVFFRG